MDPVGLARVRLAVALAAALLSADAVALAAEPGMIQVVADLDDDDLDGKPDAEQAAVDGRARTDLVNLDAQWIGADLRVISGAQHARLLLGGRSAPWGRVAAGTQLQGISPGVVHVIAVRGAQQTPLDIRVVGVGFRDFAKKSVDPAREWASLTRTPPSRAELNPDVAYDETDALRVVMELPDDAPAVTTVHVETLSSQGLHIDSLLRLPLSPASCRAGLTGVRCYASPPVRLVADDTDRTHPLVIQRSLRGEVGGALVVRDGTKKLQAIRLAGPRASSVGPIGRLRATMRPIVMRISPGGAPAVGGNDAGAIAALRGELAQAAATWGQCGVTFGPAATQDVKIMNPPPAHLLAIGDDVGLPAGGGELRVRADGRPLTVTIAPGASPNRVASSVAQALEKLGFVAVVSPNARIAPGANGSVDVSLRHLDGTLGTFDSVPGSPLSTDPTLTVRIGAVDLSDGLQHFGDMDSVAGTLEERTLLKAIDDGDPLTIEVVVVPFFAGGGRIGESFIASDQSSVRNVILLDRAGIRARRSSLTLAHELGHVLMDLPGHPDDYGVDTPTLLMDSDASDASPFGPRRLTVEECARVVKQAGPRARLPLLADWKLTPLAY